MYVFYSCLHIHGLLFIFGVVLDEHLHSWSGKASPEIGLLSGFGGIDIVMYNGSIRERQRSIWVDYYVRRWVRHFVVGWQ